MNKILNLIIWPVFLAPFAYLLAVWSKLPSKIAVHFDLSGNPDRFGDKSELLVALLTMTAIGIAIYYLLPLAYKIDPKKTAIDNKPRLKRLAFAIALFMSFICFIVIDSGIKGNLKLNIQLMFGAMGLFWCVLGNYMYNIKPNYFAGFRLPWTLSNEENWKKTHWLAAKLLFAGGLLIVITALILPKAILIFTTIAIASISTIVPIIYSYLLFRKQKALN